MYYGKTNLETKVMNMKRESYGWTKLLFMLIMGCEIVVALPVYDHITKLTVNSRISISLTLL